MLYAARIRLTSSMLGARADRKGVRCFERNADKHIVLDRDVWRWAVCEAIKAMGFSAFDADTILPHLTFRPPSMSEHIRVDGEGKRVAHESVNRGLVFTINIATVSSPKGDKREPTLDELRLILVYAGKYLGLSPWGRSRGYGLFEIVSIEPCTNP